MADETDNDQLGKGRTGFGSALIPAGTRGEFSAIRPPDVIGRISSEEGAERRAMGREIKRLRKSKGLTQNELATMLNVAPSLVGHFETGNTTVTPFNLNRLAKVFGVHPATILTPGVPIAQSSDPASVASVVCDMEPEQFMMFVSALRFRLAEGRLDLMKSILESTV